MARLCSGSAATLTPPPASSELPPSASRCAIASEVCIAFNLGGAWFATAVDDIGSAVAALLAAVACGVAACLTRRATRFGWALLAVSALAWAAGETYWSYIEVGLGLAVPSPSWADVGYLLSVPFGFAGVLVFAISASRRTEGLRALVDGLLIASSLLLVSWEAILRVTYADSSQSVVGKLVNLSYPVADVALLTIAVIALTRVSRGSRAPIASCAGLVSSRSRTAPSPISPPPPITRALRLTAAGWTATC